jgi:hypothetical protein
MFDPAIPKSGIGDVIKKRLIIEKSGSSKKLAQE